MTAGRSPCGSACATEPPIVPRFRTIWSPTRRGGLCEHRRVGRDVGRRSRRRGVASSHRSRACRPRRGCPESPGIRAMSTSVSGSVSRSLSAGIRLCPPASGMPPAPSRRRASSTLLGALVRRTPRGSRATSLLHRLPDARGLQRHLEVPDAEVAQRVDGGVDDGRGRGDRARLADALDAERVRRATASPCARGRSAASRRRSGSCSRRASRSASGRRRRRPSPRRAPARSTGRCLRAAGPSTITG